LPKAILLMSDEATRTIIVPIHELTNLELHFKTLGFFEAVIRTPKVNGGTPFVACFAPLVAGTPLAAGNGALRASVLQWHCCFCLSFWPGWRAHAGSHALVSHPAERPS